MSYIERQSKLDWFAKEANHQSLMAIKKIYIYEVYIYKKVNGKNIQQWVFAGRHRPNY
jgi:hypothetical protein